MNKDIFSGLENLGFEDVEDLDIYSSKKDEKNETNNCDHKLTKEEKTKSLLFDKEVTCPVCKFNFKVRSVKVNAARVESRDSDFFIRYNNINPYFYDVWMCPNCGYSAIKSDFGKINSLQCEEIIKNISTKFTKRNYPEIYDVNIAIERYKLALLNSVVMNAKDSRKAMNCLKIAWMYRLEDDSVNENVFLRQALDGFITAYSKEDFPMYNMDRFTFEYLLGEINKRLGDDSASLVWFSKVLSSPSASQKLKDLTRDQKDLVLESKKAKNKEEEPLEEKPEKKGLFSRLFKK